MRLNILAFAAGVLALQLQPVLPAWPLWALAGLLLCWPQQRRAGRISRGLAVIGCCALGFAWAGWRAEIRLADELGAAWEGEDVEVIGVIAGLAQEFSYGTRSEFVIEQALTAGAVVPRRVLLSWYAGRDTAQTARPALHPGERWHLTLRLKRPHGNANPQGFDYEAWLLERNIRATGYVRPQPAERLDTMVWRPAYAIERLRDAIRTAFRRTLPAEQYPWAGILIALAVGDQNAIDGDYWTVFNRAGVTHALSISGLHVTMVAALFGWLLSFIWRRIPWLALRLPAQKAGVLAACLGALFYAGLAGFAVPAQRTFYMLLVAALAMFSGRLLAPSRTLALALLVVLLIDPWAVLAAGFWLSFGAVGALFYIAAAAVGTGQGWRWQLRSWGLVQWAATLASLPVLLLVFQQFSLVSPLANALAVPLISFVLTPLVLFAALLPWWPVLAFAHWLTGWLMEFLFWCATWPVWQAPAPPWWAAVAAGLGVALCLLPRGVAGRGLGLVLLMPAAFWPAPQPEAGTAWIDVLDVGQGLATVIRTREHVLVYDPGPLYGADADAGQRVVIPYLRSLGVNRIDQLMVTHRDSDHAGGLGSVLAALPVGEVRSSLPEIAGTRCVAGQRWVWDGVSFAVLHPAAAAYAVDGKSNHLSCVLRVEAGGRAMLLTSDIEAADEAELLARDPAALAAEIMLMPHHGSKTSSTPAFLAAVGAPQAIIPVGYRNRFGHPKAEVLARYAARGTRLWRTDRDGAVQVKLAAGDVAVTAWRDERKRYWYGR